MKLSKSKKDNYKFDKLDTIVAAGITIEGKFIAKGNVRLDCNIVGDVIAEDLFLGEDAVVKGSVKCNNLTLFGKVEGNVECSKKLHIGKIGYINGDIVVDLLSMDEGAIFSGKCIKTNNEIMKKNLNSASKDKKVGSKANDGEKKTK